jgi:hypothetical protein
MEVLVCPACAGPMRFVSKILWWRIACLTGHDGELDGIDMPVAIRQIVVRGTPLNPSGEQGHHDRRKGGRQRRALRSPPV